MKQSSASDSLPRTERLVINNITLADAPFMVDLLNSPGWLQYIGDKQVRDEFSARRFIKQRFLSSYEELGYGYYLVKSIADEQPMGIVGFTNREQYEYPDFGFAFLPEFTGRGFALEASAAVFDYGQQAFGFLILDAGTLSDNHSAARLLAKLGFRALGEMENQWGQGELILHRWCRDEHC